MAFSNLLCEDSCTNRVPRAICRHCQGRVKYELCKQKSAFMHRISLHLLHAVSLFQRRCVCEKVRRCANPDMFDVVRFGEEEPLRQGHIRTKELSLSNMSPHQVLLKFHCQIRSKTFEPRSDFCLMYLHMDGSCRQQ